MTIETEPRTEPTYDAIAERAYEISQSDEAEGDLDNWLRAEREVGEEDGAAE